MTSHDQTLSYRMVQRSVRPPRAVTLIRPDAHWRGEAMRMLECYARTWGGDGNGLVACPADWQIAEPFWPLLRAFDADHWGVFRTTPKSLRMADPDAYEALVEAAVAERVAKQGISEQEARDQIEAEELALNSATPSGMPTGLDDRIRRYMSPFASVGIVVSAAFSADAAPPSRLVDMCALTYRPSRITTIDTSALPPEVQLLVAARTGLIAPDHLTLLRADGQVEHATVKVQAEELPHLLEYAWTGKVDQLSARTARALAGDTRELPDPFYATPEFVADNPFAHSRLGCTWLAQLASGLEDQPAVVVCGDTAEDFSYAFTRQRVVGNTYWLPVGSVDYHSIGPVLLNTLARVLSIVTADPASSRSVKFTSLTLSREQLEQVAQEVAETPWGRTLPTHEGRRLDQSVCDASELPTTRYLYLLDKTHFGATTYEPFLGADMARDVGIVLPSEAVGQNPDSCRWQVDMEVVGHALPARWALQPIVAAGDEPSRWAIRSSRSGISIDSHGRAFAFANAPLPQRLVQVRLRYPPADEIFTSLLTDSGATLEESDKGRYTRRMIELWGDLPSLASDLKPGPSRDLLTAWSTTGRDDQTPGFLYQSRRYLRLDDVTRASGLPEDQARQLLDRYLGLSITTRGLVLKCPQCASTAFYRLQDVGPGFQCIRCRIDNDIVRQAWNGAEEPSWFYALDEIAFQGLRSNIHVPILALSEMARTARSFLHMPEAVVHQPASPDIEVDIWAIIDGRIIIGEAKKANQLEKTATAERRRCAALRALIELLSADEFVMATASPQWDPRSVKNITDKIEPIASVKWLTDLN